LKNLEDVMEILEAFDLTGTLRGAAELPRVDAVALKIDEWVDRSRRRIRADVAHRRRRRWSIWARSARRAVAVAGRARAPVPAVGDRARAMDGLGRRRRSEGRRPVDGAVLRLAGMIAIPRRAPALGSDDAIGGDGVRADAASVRRRADPRAHVPPAVMLATRDQSGRWRGPITIVTGPTLDPHVMSLRESGDYLFLHNGLGHRRNAEPPQEVELPETAIHPSNDDTVTDLT
jgi:hypothetical protein